jgi:glycosyltransferase involved in cell wall biosynthesis
VPGVEPTDGPPLVSVIIPAYNAVRYLDEAMDSVLAQTMDDLELIVVDDGSTDATAATVRARTDPRIRLVEKENRGTVADARNAGIAAARAELLAFLDSDDVWVPSKLARQMALFDEHPELALVYCGYAITDHRLRVKTVIWPDEQDPRFRNWLLLQGNGIAPSSTSMIRRAVLDRVGGYRLELSVSEDVDLAERIASTHAVAAVDACLTGYRTHPSQGHSKLDAFEHDMTWVLADRFGSDGSRDPRTWRRGTANLHTRLFVYRLRDRQVRRALHHLARAARGQPSRIVALPAEALVRRTRRSLRLRRERRTFQFEPLVASVSRRAGG